MSARPAHDAGAVARAAGRLAAAGAELRERPADAVLESLAEWIDRLRAPASPGREGLARELAAAAGFHEATVGEGLSRALGAWSAHDFRRLVRSERSAADSVAGFDTTALVLAGAIPMPGLLSIALALSLRSPVLVKCAARDPVTAEWAARSLTEVDPLLGRCVEPLRFGHGDAACLDAFLAAADCVVATGSDDAVASLAARVGPPRRFVGYGHRLSLAVVGPEADLETVARDLAVDVALWDQLGCLSPVAVWCIERTGLARSDALALALAHALAEAEHRWPRGECGTAAAARFHSERALAEVRDVPVHTGSEGGPRGGADGRFCVVREADATRRPAPLHRFVRVHPVAHASALLDALRPLGPHLAGVALAGFGDATRALASRLADLGASRVCEPGRLQTPPLDWHHDGRPLLLPLARLTDWELP